MIKMTTVYVSVDPEEASDNGPDGVTEVPRERNTFSRG